MSTGTPITIPYALLEFSPTGNATLTYINHRCEPIDAIKKLAEAEPLNKFVLLQVLENISSKQTLELVRSKVDYIPEVITQSVNVK